MLQDSYRAGNKLLQECLENIRSSYHLAVPLGHNATKQTQRFRTRHNRFEVELGGVIAWQFAWRLVGGEMRRLW